MKRQNFDDYEDDEFGVGGYIKSKNRNARLRDREKEMRHGGRASRAEWAASFMEDEEDTLDIEKIEIQTSRPEPLKKAQKKESQRLAQTPQKEKETSFSSSPVLNSPAQSPSALTFGPNSHPVKGRTIDFDRVAAIEKVENTYNNKLTYGIKFTFMGKKGLSYTAWFNQNVRERDSSYETEFAFWNSLKNK